jgi:hypothetical protein
MNWTHSVVHQIISIKLSNEVVNQRLVIIINVNISGTGTLIVPLKYQSELLIDSNAPVACQLAFQSLQAISGWHQQIFNPLGTVQHLQLSLRLLLK